jgi:hypothetical protein
LTVQSTGKGDQKFEKNVKKSAKPRGLTGCPREKPSSQQEETYEPDTSFTRLDLFGMEENTGKASF